MRAIVQAIHTRNAARIVDGMLLGVDTRRFALACTNAAIDTFIGVDNGLQQRIFRQISEHGADRANRVAIRSATAPCKHNHNNRRHSGNYQRRQALKPHVNAIECVTVGAFRNVCQQIVRITIYRLKKVARNSAVRSIGVEQRCNRHKSGNERNHHQHQKCNAQPTKFGAELIG